MNTDRNLQKRRKCPIASVPDNKNQTTGRKRKNKTEENMVKYKPNPGMLNSVVRSVGERREGRDQN